MEIEHGRVVTHCLGFPDRDARRETDAGRIIREERAERKRVPGERPFADGSQGLDADFGIRVCQQREDDVGGGLAQAFFRQGGEFPQRRWY